jgi:DNA-binding SARP family transcriptional activator
LLACAQVVSSYYYAYVDYAPMQIWVTCIERLLAEAVTLADIADEADLYTALVFAVTWLAQMDEKPVTARAERLLLDPALEANQQVSLAYALSDFYTLGSRMTDARRVMTNVSLDKGRGVTTLNLVYARLQLGYQMLRAGEYENAAVLWDEADRIAAEDGLTQTRFLSSVFRSFLHSCRLQVEQAEAQLAGLAIEATDAQPLSAALYHVAKVFAALAREDARAAARHARISLVHATRLGGGFVNVAWRAHGSAALAMAGDHAEAERWIDEGLRWASGSWLECYQTNLLMSRAYSLLLRGERSAAHAVMARMLELARENDWWTYLRIVPNVKDIVVREAVAASIDPPFCKRLVRELRVSPGSEPPEQWPWEVRLYALGPFLVERHGAPLAFGRKAQKRPLALLKALVALGPEGVDAGRLASALWPDAEADDAADSLNMAVHRLRNLIGEETVSVRDGKISLNSQLVWTDTGALVRVLDAIEDSEAASAEQQVQTLEQLYRGHFLEHEPQESWLLPLQQRLRGRIHRAILSLGRRLEEGRAWEQAVALYERGIDLDPLAERLYARLMHCHLESGRASAATAAYRRCCEMLSKMAGTAPSTETQAIHAAILSATIR